jgi:hypothetical protein
VLAILAGAVVVSATALVIHFDREERLGCERWREDFAIAAANMDKALALDDRGMVKALGQDFGRLLSSQPDGCPRPLRPL